MSDREIMNAKGFNGLEEMINFRDPVVERVVESLKSDQMLVTLNMVRLLMKREQRK